MMAPLRELKTLVKFRTTETRDTVGFNLAAMKAIARLANERKQKYQKDSAITDVWGTSLGKY
jgi:uncharacterized protein (UPF0335 family)